MLLNLKSYFQLQQICSSQQDCISYLEKIIWNGKPVSPFDAESKVYKCAKGRYRCKNTGKYFNVMKGTMLENTNLPLKSWFYAIWKITTSGSGITSVDLAVDMGITQKTAWFLLHRIRACFEVENNHKLSGIVGADETWYGGKNKNRHVSKKVNYKNTNKENPDKTLILGMIEKGGNIVCKVIPNRSKEAIQPIVIKYVTKDSNLITDEHTSYSGLSNVYNHTALNHKAYEYVSKSDTSISNNNIECSWRILKRTASGTYHHVCRKHLQSYIDEFVFRYNLKDLTPSDKFHSLLSNSNKRTRFSDLKKREFLIDENDNLKTYKGTPKGGKKIDNSIQKLDNNNIYKRYGKI